jgi:hypothetical protein
LKGETVRKVKLLVTLAVVVVPLTVAAAKVQGKDAPQSVIRPFDVAPIAFTFTDTGTTVAVSIHGNTVQFESPDGYEHIGIGAFSEGYIACYTAPVTGSREAVDTGDNDNGVWGDAVVGASSITRSTDGPNGDGGKVQLRQSYAFGPGDRRLRITHRLTNMTNDTLTDVSFRRQVDFDIDTGGASGWAFFANDFATDGNDRVMAWNTPGEAPAPTDSHSMALRALDADSPHDARVTSNILDPSCDADSAVSPDMTSDEVDYGGTLRYQIGELGPRKSAHITLQYDR